MLTRQKAHPILLALLKVQQKYNNDYSWPSQQRLLELLDSRQGVKKSRATLNRWLRVIEDDKYILRRRRLKRHPLYGLLFKSTLYKITIKGYRLLHAFGVEVSFEIARYQSWLDEIRPKREKSGPKKLQGPAGIPVTSLAPG